MTNSLRKISKKVLAPVISLLTNIGVTPNLVTVIGMLGHFLCAWLAANGFFKWSAVSLLLFGLFDAIDGSLARHQQKISKFGAFLDSVSDRFSEIIVFLGLFLYFIDHQSFDGCFLVLIACFSALLVSYTRARAESVGVDVRIGIMTRVERYIVLILSFLLEKIEIGLLVLAILGIFTVGQRVWFVYNDLKNKE